MARERRFSEQNVPRAPVKGVEGRLKVLQLRNTHLPRTSASVKGWSGLECLVTYSFTNLFYKQQRQQSDAGARGEGVAATPKTARGAIQLLCRSRFYGSSCTQRLS